MEQFNKVGPFNTAKELWDKLTELNEGSTESRRAKRDLLINQLQTFSMKPNETVSQMHGRFKEIVNGLHVIGEKIENRDLIRYVLNSFPRTTLWVSMVDAYKVSKDLSIIKLDELFCEFELHEQTNSSSKEKGLALFVGKREKKKKEKKEVYSSSSESEDNSSSSEDELSASEVAHYVKKFGGRSRKFTKKDVKRMFQSSKGKSSTSSSNTTNVTCYGCNKKGHIKPNCPELKKKDEKEKKKKDKKEKKKKEAMVAQTTWDTQSIAESSDEEELCHITRHMAFMAIGDEESSQEEASSSSSNESSSSDDDEVNDSPQVDLLYKTIACLKNALNRSKSKVKGLRLELSATKGESSLCHDACSYKLENDKLKDEITTLRTSLEKFTNGSKYLDMIIGSQRAIYNKAGIGYKPKNKEVAFVSLTNRRSTIKEKGKKAWVPKRFLDHITSPSIWVPKEFVFHVV